MAGKGGPDAPQNTVASGDSVRASCKQACATQDFVALSLPMESKQVFLEQHMVG